MRTDRTVDRLPVVLFLAHLAQALLFARTYPQGIYDPDLLAYFVYFRNWLHASTALHGVEYFTVPKPLLVFALGPLASVSWAFACSAVASAVLGVVVYRIGRDVFGRTTGLLWSLALLLDVEKAVLALRSSADLWVAVLLFLAIAAALRARAGQASIWLLLSALVKPVTLPCAFAVLIDDRLPVRRRLLCAAVPLLALPLVLAANHALVGDAMGPGRFFAGFDALGEGEAIGAPQVLHFVVWSQLVRHTFVLSAPLGFLGLGLWLADDKRRLTSPLLLLPLLFLAGYVGLGFNSAYVPFFRFWWAIEVWFAGFIVYGALEGTRRLVRTAPRLQIAAAAVLLCLLGGDYVVRQLRYREHFAAPFQDAMAFVTTTPDTLLHRHAGETVMTPLAFMPYLVWELGMAAPSEGVVTAEEVANGRPFTPPHWVLYVPSIYASREARKLVDALLAGGAYTVRLTDGHAALLERGGGTADERVGG